MLCGVLGDYPSRPTILSRCRCSCVAAGRRCRSTDPGALAGALPEATGTILLTVHGSCMNNLQWRRRGHDHPDALAGALGWTRVDVLYNSGLHVSRNGELLADQLEALHEAWPVEVERIVILAHSMGGLVARAACRSAEAVGRRWRSSLRGLVCLGTPHHGAPLERGGNWIDVLLEVSPYSAPLAGLGKIRSAGVTDLRFGNVLQEHWRGRDRFEPGADARSPLPCPRACPATPSPADEAAAATDWSPWTALWAGMTRRTRRWRFRPSTPSRFRGRRIWTCCWDPRVHAAIETWLRALVDAR